MNQETRNPSLRKKRTLFRQNEQNPQNDREIILSILLILSTRSYRFMTAFLSWPAAFEIRGRAKQYSNTPALNHANRAYI